MQCVGQEREDACDFPAIDRRFEVSDVRRNKRHAVQRARTMSIEALGLLDKLDSLLKQDCSLRPVDSPQLDDETIRPMTRLTLAAKSVIQS